MEALKACVIGEGGEWSFGCRGSCRITHLCWQSGGVSGGAQDSCVLTLGVCVAGAAVHPRPTPANLWAGVRNEYCSGPNQHVVGECCCGQGENPRRGARSLAATSNYGPLAILGASVSVLVKWEDLTKGLSTLFQELICCGRSGYYIEVLGWGTAYYTEEACCNKILKITTSDSDERMGRRGQEGIHASYSSPWETRQDSHTHRGV